MDSSNEIQLEVRTSALTRSNGNISDCASVQTEITRVGGSCTTIDEVNDAVTRVSSGGEGKTIVTTDDKAKYLIYGVNDSPPIHVTVVCALQVNTYFLFSLMFINFSVV